ncbi:unnamed protein product, partial [Prorocentrum cordatum]
MVYCTGASRWGAGVARCPRAREGAQDAGHYSERMRYSAAHEAVPKPWDSAVKCPVSGGVTASPQDSEIPKAPFPEVPKSEFGGDWSLVMSQKRSRTEVQVVLEARALVLTVKHVARNISNFGHEHLILNDSMAPILAVTKDRSPSPGMLQCCRQIAALHLGSNYYVGWRWVPSELNAADAASRGRVGAVRFDAAPTPVAAFGPDRLRVLRDGFCGAERGDVPGRGRAARGCPADPTPRARGRPGGLGHSPRPWVPRWLQSVRQTSFLELQSIAPKAALDHRAYVSAFHERCKERGLVEDFDRFLTSREKFFAGKLACAPRKLMAGLRYSWTFQFGATLEPPRSTRGLTGWKHMVPAQSRRPCPWVGLRLCAQRMIGAGQVLEAMASIIAFTFYFRPRERLRLKGQPIAAPASSRGGQPTEAGALRSILLRPQEGADTSKTGKAKTPSDALVFPFGQAQWTRALKAAALAGNLSLLGEFSLCRLRHGGVSHDLLFKVRSLFGAKKRGHWASGRSLARYERGGRINEQLSLLDLRALPS